MRKPVIVTGRMVGTGMILFFSIIFVVNGIFFCLALKTWPGLVTERAYESGLAYNDVLEQARRQRDTGWSATVDIVQQADGHAVTVTIPDTLPALPESTEVGVVFRRPVNDVGNILLPLEESWPGTYSASVDLPVRGRWYVDLSVTQAGQVVYLQEYEIMVQP